MRTDTFNLEFSVVSLFIVMHLIALVGWFYWEVLFFLIQWLVSYR